jgi:hypothetical protein
MNSNDEERERPSWKEIDRKKDRSRHVSRDSDNYRPKSRKAKWAQKMYLKEAENLFKGKKASKEHSLAHEAIHKYADTKKFSSAVKKYIKEYNLPDDWSTLFLLLDYNDTEVVKQVIVELKEMSIEQPISIKEGLKSKLRIIAMTTSDEELRNDAEEALEDL